MLIKKLLLALLVLVLGVPPVFAQPTSYEFRHKVYSASLQLYWLNSDNPEEPPLAECMATPFQRKGNTYQLLTAAHCVIEQHSFGPAHWEVPIDNKRLRLGYGDPGKQVMIPVSVKATGNPAKKWDIAILEATTDINLPVIPLGDSRILGVGDSVISVSAPLGGDLKLYYKGYVSQPVENTTGALKGWDYMLYLQIGGTSGSSGAAVISPDQKAIIGIFIGQFRQFDAPYDVSGMAMFPVSRIKEFIADPMGHGGISTSVDVVLPTIPHKAVATTLKP